LPLVAEPLDLAFLLYIDAQVLVDILEVEIRHEAGG
jgi:hypothetical protein